MIIVSQSKETIVNFNNIIDITTGTIDDKYEISFETDDMVGTLGIYKTKERAKGVLQSIIIAKNSDSKIYEMPEE